SAARDPRPADRADEGAGRTGEPPGAAVDRGRLRHLERSGTGPPIDGERRMTSVLIDDVKRAAGEDEIVAADLGRVAGPVRALDDAADTGEHAAHGDHTARDGSLARGVRRHQAA